MGKGEMKSLEFLIKRLPWRIMLPREEDLEIIEFNNLRISQDVIAYQSVHLRSIRGKMF